MQWRDNLEPCGMAWYGTAAATAGENHSLLRMVSSPSHCHKVVTTWKSWSRLWRLKIWLTVTVKRW